MSLMLLVGIVGFAIFVSANSMIADNDFSYNVEVSVEKGWNIIAGILPKEAISGNSEIKVSNIKAVWYYPPKLKKYFQVHPNLDELSSQVDDDVALTSAMWVYSDKAGTLKYNTLEDYLPLSMRELSAGYNFVTITPDMTVDVNTASPEEEEKYTFNAMKGNCNIQKVYFFDNVRQQWGEFPLTEELDSNTVGNGVVVKVSNDCKLSKPAQETNQPPNLP